MKYLLLTVWCSISFSSFAFAQESVGFSDPENIRPLLDYRLPDWGYTNFYWDFSLNGNLRSRQSDNQQNTSTLNEFSGQIAPVYLRYRESEPRVSSYSIRPDINYSFQTGSNYNNDEDYQSELDLLINWNFDEKLYFDESDLFFSGIFSGNFRQSRYRFEDTVQDVTVRDETNLYRSFAPSVSIGLGYGRLRGVNPVIRALRFNERFNTLDTDQPLSQGDMFEAADQFTRLLGYQQVYDRPEKYFWGDMDNLLSADLAALDPFDLLYLADTVSEAIGSRQEGWQVQVSARLQHQINYNRVSMLTGGSDSSLSRALLFTPFVTGTWYKNLSLNHQLGISGTFQKTNVLSGNNSREASAFNTRANWISTITDKILVDSYINYFRHSRDTDPYSLNIISIGSDVNYFIENRFSLFAGIFYIYVPNSQVSTTNGTILNSIDERNFAFSAGVRYYMKRGLY